jgi:hypothetical protein
MAKMVGAPQFTPLTQTLGAVQDLCGQQDAQDDRTLVVLERIK